MSVYLSASTNSRNTEMDFYDGLGAGHPGFDSRQGQVIFLYSTASRPVLGPTQPPVQWIP
jgi:hypothetical protein